ncbi:MAG: efflux RND transporter periplasmic adaptor subunit [Thermodesulfobacteriota bacterium]
MKKVWIGIVLAALLACGSYLYYRNGNGAAAYRIAKVERGDIADTITATGNIAAVITVSVGSQISGTISELLADYNSRVRKGQVIARIDPRLLEAAVLQARGNLESARAALERADVAVTDTGRTYRRNTELLKDGFVSQADVDAAQTAYEQAVASRKSAEAAVVQATGSLKVAETNLEYATIRSPVDGIVISRDVDVGQTVAASFQTPTLFSIAQDLTKMQIDTNVDESDIGRAAVGQPVIFTVDAWPERSFTGIVAQVRNAPIVTQNVVTYNVVIHVDNRDLLLKPGMTANVTILVKKYENVLKVPNPALRFRPADKADGGGGRPAARRQDAPSQRVYRIGPDGKPAAVPVKTGVSDGTFTALLEGDLKEGDELIVDQTSKRSASAPGGGPMGMNPMRGFR